MSERIADLEAELLAERSAKCKAERERDEALAKVLGIEGQQFTCRTKRDRLAACLKRQPLRTRWKPHRLEHVHEDYEEEKRERQKRVRALEGEVEYLRSREISAAELHELRKDRERLDGLAKWLQDATEDAERHIEYFDGEFWFCRPEDLTPDISNGSLREAIDDAMSKEPA